MTCQKFQSDFSKTQGDGVGKVKVLRVDNQTKIYQPYE